MEALPDKIVGQILIAAKEALSRNQRRFTCSAPATHAAGVFGKLNQKKALKTTEFDLGQLIDWIENVGWMLEQVDHVVVPISSGGSGAMGHTSSTYSTEVRAQLLFRRANA